MSNNLIKFTFTAGEISPKLLGRTDLEQYDMGMAKAQNYIVDYRGGLTTRAGQFFCEYVWKDEFDTRFHDFTFSFSPEDTYMVLFGEGYVRFLQDGSYVLEDPFTITDITDDIVTTSAAHGYAIDDWVKISGVNGFTNVNGRTYIIVAVPTATTFQIEAVPDYGTFVPDGTYVDDGIVERIYTVETPYDGDDLAELCIYQIRDTLRITHRDYTIYNLTRNDHTDWVFEEEDIGETDRGPSGLSHTTTTIGSAQQSGAIYCVTALFKDGSESPPSRPYRAANCDHLPSVNLSSVTLSWNTRNDAVAYRVYRSVFFRADADMDKGAEVGYVGQVTGAQFTDNNIVPDFTIKPPEYYHPFKPGQITDVFVTANGSGYGFNAGLTVTDATGSGYSGVVIVNSAGKVIGVKTLRGGKRYTNPSGSISTGTGATVSFETRALTGTYPGISTVFQQRQIYAGSREKPLTVWASKPRQFSNFDFSEIVVDSDSYEYDLDSKEVSPILHAIPMRGGLLLMSQSGLWQMTNGADGVVTATAAMADYQTYLGSTELAPLTIGQDLLYVEGRGYTVRLLSYNDLAKVYAGEDKSLLSNHLFDQYAPIVRWAFAENPMKMVYAVKKDGSMLAMSIVREEKVFAWTPLSTRGFYRDVRVVRENNLDQTYVMVQRYINGTWRKYIEKLAPKDVANVEDVVAMDSALSLWDTKPNAILTPSAITGNGVTFTASNGVFTADDVGKIIRIGGGKAVVTGYTSSTVVTGNILRDITYVMPETDNVPMDAKYTEWTLDEPVTEISGLWHLEGMTVQVLGDGNVLQERVVTNGSITIEVPCTRVHVGLKFTAIARTLPLTATDVIMEGRRKRVPRVAVRLYDSRGLKTGTSLDTLYEIRERNSNDVENAIPLQSGSFDIMVTPEWDDAGQVYFVTDYPLPVTLLAVVFDMELGDDND